MTAERLVIVGVPKSGKTTATAGCLHVRHTDDLMHVEWHEVSAIVSTWFDVPGPWIVEGVRAVHALRKWLAAHPEGTPADRVVWRGRAFVDLDRGQQAMAKGCNTVWQQVRPQLLARNVQVEEL